MKLSIICVLPYALCAWAVSLHPSFAAGNLTPPGPPGPTMKSLDEVEPRRPISSLPFTISQSGSYYVVSNLLGVAGLNGITISANDVTLDLGGFVLTGLTTARDGVFISEVRTNVAVRNGTVRGWGGDGVDASTAVNSEFRDLRVSKNGAHGLFVGGGSTVNACVGRANGTVIGESVCSGYIYAGNVGWIHLGDGSPSNGIRYQNNSAADYGVNRDELGHLRGYAYAANIGWVNFEDQGAPAVDLRTGVLSGYIYSANAGWISLSNALAGGTRVFVQTHALGSSDSDGDGIADDYEVQWAGGLLVMDATTDQDGDGISDRDESIADTNPTDPADFLFITAISTADGGLHCDITWTSRPTRQYRIEKRDNLALGAAWVDSGRGLLEPALDRTTTATVLNAAAAYRFFRVQVLKPLEKLERLMNHQNGGVR